MMMSFRFRHRVLRHAALLLLITGCRESPWAAAAPPATVEKAAGKESLESPELRKARESLEQVTLRDVVFESTSAGEAVDYVEFKVRELAPDLNLRIVLRRAVPPGMTLEEAIGRDICYSGHDFRAAEVSAWELLELVAGDNGMEIVWSEDRLELRPKAEGSDLILMPVDE
ncbi:hypothetical protein [Luteolibacter luteus]|uniref:Lipoprotein n=1 Tax=Luteolibacter luteus TaxID=2728835 RepID=A0A858RQE0_9BACT|nr:hypothetical protein [Luteolibacter luteus]QJE98841.1 hypothetical protein HHL09_24690 [Luteolibacter luteus]